MDWQKEIYLCLLKQTGLVDTNVPIAVTSSSVAGVCLSRAAQASSPVILGLVNKRSI